jgi:hypothetical protein
MSDRMRRGGRGRFAGYLGAATIAALGALPGGSAHGQGAVAFQPQVATFPDGVILNVTPVVTADRRYVRFVNLNPQFIALQEFNTFIVPGAVSGGGIGGGFGGFGGGVGGGFGGGGGGAGIGPGGGGGGFASVPPGALGAPMMGAGPASDPFAAAYAQASLPNPAVAQPTATPPPSRAARGARPAPKRRVTRSR